MWIDAVTNSIIYILLLIILIGGGIFVWYISQFKHRIHCYRQVNGALVYKSYKAKEEIGKDGTQRWKVMQRNAFPPLGLIKVDPKFITLNEKGKYIYNCIKNQHNEPVGISLEYDEENEIAKYVAFPSDERAEYMQQLEKVRDRMGGQLMQMVLPVAAIGVLLAVIVIMIVFWGDINKPALEMADKLEAIEVERTEQLKIIQEIRDDVQIIRSGNVIPSNRSATLLPPGGVAANE